MDFEYKYNIHRVMTGKHKVIWMVNFNYFIFIQQPSGLERPLTIMFQCVSNAVVFLDAHWTLPIDVKRCKIANYIKQKMLGGFESGRDNS
jgi:hypothetical protein